ncbi:DUF4249 family protein [Flavilitoribacter nigricans]|uniref:DUF4249 domain-containing protein n=1 Tax=Flavilitoribacter nigricans (strain ATCC 23147 / DSM 23189 / NBRC 102662 / NCIMB 1420 / SS-2) TaxID=1122177 RepID=A0A2D0NHG2_FLAN2|nr:DUF4249 family protein [Flavilitoribacter nigricans]PHN07921.1 hypothetical protein CRP01_03975 [Flavilitoribacter nigricans DSM 23189 = NBRC 102662]
MHCPTFLKSFIRVVSVLLLGQWGLLGCLTEIDLEAPESVTARTAIRGKLVASDQPYVLVEITNVSDYRAADIPEAVIGAEVLLTTDAGEAVLLPMRRNGEYYLDLNQPGPLSPDIGENFQLTVTTPEGRTYQSDWEPLRPVPTPAGITQVSETRMVLNNVGNTVEQEFLRFLVNTPITNPEDGTGAFLKWEFSGVFRITESTLDLPIPPQAKICYIREVVNLENVVVFNGNAGRTEQLESFFLLEEPYDYRFYEGYYLTVRQQSLSENAHQYWAKISEVVNRSGNFFESPAGKVTGNFRNVVDTEEEVFGYFYATEEITLHYRVQRGEKRIFPLCPTLVKPDADGVNYLCFNCLDHPKSSEEKPAFWID